jgi:hypothetical protein
MTALRNRLLFLIIIVVFCSVLTGKDKTGKPVCIVAESYGRYEASFFIKNTLTISSDLEYLYENRGTFPPMDELDRYSLIAIFHSTARPFTPEESRKMLNYLESGGHLLLGSWAPRAIAGDIGADKIPWIGVKRVYMGRGAQGSVLKPEHPFLKGVFDTVPSPQWLASTNLGIPASPDFETLIGTPNKNAMVGWQRIGKGWVVFLGHEFFRIRPKIPPAEADAYIRMLRNIVAAANPLTEAERREKAVDAAAADGTTKVLLWNREWQRSEEYGPRFDPPLPSKEERIKVLYVNMAVDEYESVQINLTPLEDIGLISWNISSENFPVGNVRFFVQDKPDPIPWPKDPEIAKESPYWLMPPEYIVPEGKKEFFAPAGETHILWLKINSAGVTPNNYTVTLTLSSGGKTVATVPVEIKVYPVRILRPRLITLEPAGQVYGDVNNPEPALRFTKNLEEHGYEWSLINTVRADKIGIVGETGPLTPKILAEVAGRIGSPNPPRLNCSSFDPWMEQAISHGLINFKVGNPVATINRILAKSGLPEEVHGKIRRWFLEEISRYLREKGVRLMVTSYGDELSEKEISERFIPWAKTYTEAGWGCSSSFTGAAHLKPELNGLLYPYVKLWTLNRSLALAFTEGVKNGKLKVRPDAILGTYGAGEGRGSEHRKPLGMSRFLGWESWMNGIQNCATNPYFKGWLYYTRYSGEHGIAGERWVSYINKDDISVPLADCPFLGGISEGMEEGNLCAILSWYLDHMESMGGRAEDTAKKARKQFTKVLGDSPDSIIRWEMTTAYGMPFKKLPLLSEPYTKAKAEVLDILLSIRNEAIASIKPSAYWHTIPLVRDGKAVAAIYGEAGNAKIINDTLQNLCGITLPVFSSDVSPETVNVETAVIIGNGEKNSLTAAFFREMKELDADQSYPGRNGYFIRERKLPEGKTTGFFIAGPDSTGTSKGVQLFTKFLRAEGAWLLP